MKVHKGDTVIVVSGKDKGAKGKVLVAYPDRDKVLVEGVNRIKKHTSTSATAAPSRLSRARDAGPGVCPRRRPRARWCRRHAR